LSEHCLLSFIPMMVLYGLAMKVARRRISLIFYVAIIMLAIFISWNRLGRTRLIIRADDMGFCHGVNLACIEAYQQGILTAVEVMVPCDYFAEAVQMLNENPGLDVGIHLTLNSEWENIKWGPITEAPSLVDENGYFFPRIWPDDRYPANTALDSADWKLSEIEKELRAQIEVALDHLPNCSHATPHMGFHAISPKVSGLVMKLLREYNIDANIRMLPMKQVYLFGDASTVEEMVINGVETLEKLGPGTWECYEHPGMIIAGEEPAWHLGAEDDAIYRDAVTKALTDDRLKEVIRRKRIKLIGYRDLKSWNQKWLIQRTNISRTTSEKLLITW